MTVDFNPLLKSWWDIKSHQFCPNKLISNKVNQAYIVCYRVVLRRISHEVHSLYLPIVMLDLNLLVFLFG